MKEAMDLFGEAVTDYFNGGRDTFAFIEPGKSAHPHDLKRYFTHSSKFTKLEKRLASLAQGRVLDVGCATANYFPLFNGVDVLGIDISPKMVALANMNGLNCQVGDIFDFETDRPYDTITFLENNLGLAGTIPRLKNLLNKLDTLLKPEGQILVEMKKVSYIYHSANLRPAYKGEIGPEFTWLNIGTKYLKEICAEIGFSLEIIDHNRKSNLIRISRIPLKNS